MSFCKQFLLLTFPCLFRINDYDGWYWMYKMGEKCDQIKGVNGSSGILYLILGIFGLGIVSYCLMQDTINKAIM